MDRFQGFRDAKLTILIFFEKFFASYISITPRNLQVKFCICCISLSTSIYSLSVLKSVTSLFLRYYNYSLSKMLLPESLHQNFKRQTRLCRQNHVSYISCKNKDFVFHFAATRNSYLMFYVQAILFLSILLLSPFILVLSYQDYDTFPLQDFLSRFIRLDFLSISYLSRASSLHNFLLLKHTSRFICCRDA